VITLATTGQNVAYDPSTNLDINSGKVQPTAVRQTVTLLFGQALPGRLLSGHTLTGHPGRGVQRG
jgi:hypothetical protein